MPSFTGCSSEGTDSFEPAGQLTHAAGNGDASLAVGQADMNNINPNLIVSPSAPAATANLVAVDRLASDDVSSLTETISTDDAAAAAAGPAAFIDSNHSQPAQGYTLEEIRQRFRGGNIEFVGIVDEPGRVVDDGGLVSSAAATGAVTQDDSVTDDDGGRAGDDALESKDKIEFFEVGAWVAK